MTLRTSRRRVSPRTKRKYQAIKNFFRRTLGTSSQGYYINNTNSSIEISVSELKSKIDILEQQLDRVSKHCQDLADLEQTINKETDILTKDLTKERDLDLETIQNPKKTNRYPKNVETELIYQNLSRELRKRNKSANVINVTKHDERKSMESFEPTYSKNINNGQVPEKRIENKKSYDRNENFDIRHKYIKPKYNKVDLYSLSSYHSLAVPAVTEYPNPSQRKHQRNRRKDYITDERVINEDKPDPARKYKRYEPFRQNKHEYRKVDEEFIADIIKRQYQPVKLFGKRHSDFSQFSAPVCRDQEYKVRHDVKEGSELCSCCYNDVRKPKHRYVRNSDLSDMRSICDTHLYSSKRYRSRSHRRRYIDDYNNETLYDVIPVKEKSSPKSRKKFAEDNIFNYYCKEVPPSPKTHRPRLNLKVHNYAGFDEGREYRKHQNLVDSPIRENCGIMFNEYETDFSVEPANKSNNENLVKITKHKSAQIEEETGTKILQSPNFNNDQLNISKDTTLNTQTTDDKTDKALGEIKDILQSFLLEIKKESTHDGKSNMTSKTEDKNSNEQQHLKTNINLIPNSKENFNYNMGQCSMAPFLPPFPNPCCYPIVPMNMCPINCLHNGYIIPNPSFTCMACAKNSKDNTSPGRDYCNNKSKTSQDIATNNETQELIKEIYKFVSQNPKSVHKDDNGNIKYPKSELHKKTKLTNRSAGDSTKTFKHDANVGTPIFKSISKSCEAFGSRMVSDTYRTTNASYSDTVLEKLSLEASESSTESDISSYAPVVKDKRSKFKKVLQSLRLIKKKRDVIEELSESKSSAEVTMKPKPPFQQHVTNYAVHGQEFFHTPPIPKHHCPAHPHQHSHNYDQKNSFHHHIAPNEIYDQHRHYCDPINAHCNPTRYSPGPFCPNYDPRFNQIQPPQVPLCLKEIEVKSIGTQSVRKMSIFQKFTKKMQPQQDVSQQYIPPPLPPLQKKLTLWKSLQEKAKQQDTDPLDFSLKTQKQLAQGDMKLRNALLKKLFYKRNPFSPRNLIVRTLLGKDKSSFGNPPKMYKPRMFL